MTSKIDIKAIYKGKTWHPPDPSKVRALIEERQTEINLSPELYQILVDQIKDEIADQIPDNTRPEVYVTKDRSILQRANADFYAFIGHNNYDDFEYDPVHIVIPVYNSINLVKECLDALFEQTNCPFQLTIVDDASDQHTKDELAKYITENQFRFIELVTNKKNLGFAASVNKGIRHNPSNRSYKYTCLLNSDVLVTDKWLDKMKLALESNPANVICNPVTNNTAIINVNMYPGYSYTDMNQALQLNATRSYPEIFPTGFCFLFKNFLLDEIGFFDENYKNFGEESDFVLRAVSHAQDGVYKRYRCVLADDTYVFHQRSASYSSLGIDAETQFRQAASKRFSSTHPNWKIWSKSLSMEKNIAPLKVDAGPELLNSLHGNLLPVCYVVHSTQPCGAMNYIADIVNKLENSRIVLIQRNSTTPIETLPELRCAPIIFKSVRDFIENFESRVFKQGIVIAATSELAIPVYELCKNKQKLKAILHAQSYEPSLNLDKNIEAALEANYNLLPTVITSSKWVADTLVNKKIEVDNIFLPGVDHDIYYPRNRELGDDRLTLMIPLIPDYWFKGADRAVALIEEIQKLAFKHKHDIRIVTYGSDQVNLHGVINYGKIPRNRVATLLGTEVDLFLDPAYVHSYGMPCLEAMATAVPFMCWDNKGVYEYISNPNLTIIDNNADIKDVASRVLNTLIDPKARELLRYEQLGFGEERKQSVLNIVEYINNEHRPFKPLKMVFVTPHLRKHGGPTTIITTANLLAKKGHDVSICTIYSDINPEVAAYTDLPIIILGDNPPDFKKIPHCDVLFVNSDNPWTPQLSKLSHAHRRIMFKLSHNPRFKELEETGLRQKWHGIITSSQWLADVCENPKDWNYQPVKATRVGWYHYNFERMKRNIRKKKLNRFGQEQIIISTLIHQHPLKGSKIVSDVLAGLKAKYQDRIRIIGVGEIVNVKDLNFMPQMEYMSTPSRDELADLMHKTDIWISASQSEGLGRMALEAMTGGAAVVGYDTGAEFVVHDTNALTVPINDVQGLYDTMDKLIPNDQERVRLSMNAYATAKGMADSSDYLFNLERAIEDAL